MIKFGGISKFCLTPVLPVLNSANNNDLQYLKLAQLQLRLSLAHIYPVSLSSFFQCCHKNTLRGFSLNVENALNPFESFLSVKHFHYALVFNFHTSSIGGNVGQASGLPQMSFRGISEQ